MKIYIIGFNKFKTKFILYLFLWRMDFEEDNNYSNNNLHFGFVFCRVYLFLRLREKNAVVS